MKKIITLLFFINIFIYAQPSDKYVILVIIDGARYSETMGDSQARFIPFIKRLSQKGVIIDTFMNDGVTMTNRGIPAIWCGSWSIPKDTIVNGFTTQYATVPSIWEYYRKAFNADSTQALYILKYISSLWLPSFHSQYGSEYWPWTISQGKNDLDVWQNTKSTLLTFHPRLTVMYLSDVDTYGHSGDWSQYTGSIMVADSIVGWLCDMIDSDQIFKDKTNIFVTNDHGRHLDGISSGFSGHGDDCWGCRHIMFMAYGPNIKKGIHLNNQYTIPDITPTIGYILGFSTPLSSGHPILELFESLINVIQENYIESFKLCQNYPNPFNASTKIEYSIDESSFVILKIYDIYGREIETLINKSQDPGSYSINWEPIQHKGLSSGVYYYQLVVSKSNPLKTVKRSEVKKLIYLR